jgi:hypothetical protein
MPLHPFNLRCLAEDLVRRRRADDPDRYAASQRQARIDPNPHQIDAVIFALRRLDEGGCILADEVGLGKTIEAGLVIAQGRAEGRERVLLVVPRPLLGQWQAELHALFAIDVRELTGPTAAPGVWIIGREAAGGVRGSEWLRAAPFDLVVIDEAHEMFAGIYKRYRSDGSEDPEAASAMTAHRVRDAIGHAPVLVLTATPIQNSLVELWGLAQYVEPTRTLFGDLATFRQVFCDGDDRRLVPGQEHELQRRIATICKRTLRRQAQEFLDRPFVDRACRLFEYDMSDDERALYEDVTEWLLRPVLHAFKGSARRLLLIGFHRRMASSHAALAASLENVARRLAALAAGQPVEPLDRELLGDLDDEDEVDEALEPDAALPDPASLADELALVRSFAKRARAMPFDAKAQAFQRAIALVLERGRTGVGSGKAVVFTESITTQEYIRDVLLGMGLAPEDITLFRGNNDDPRARAALSGWRAGAGSLLPSLPSNDIQVRLALVDEFRSRSKIIVCTEAGAKGLNLQFCETVINYDLPWNPQRIEQRIGRCHRYGQTRGVLVVNFLARDNEAHRLTFEILSQKLDLFGRVLDASDAVLHEPRRGPSDGLLGALSADFERELGRIHDRARSVGDVTRDMLALRDTIAERRSAYDDQQRTTAALIESRFDDEVKQVFKGLRTELSDGLARLDANLATLVPDHTGPERLTLVHPAVVEAIARARGWTGAPVAFDAPTPELAGGRGALTVAKVSYGGFDPVERLVVAAVVDGVALEAELATALARQTARDGSPGPIDELRLEEALQEALFFDQQEIEGAEQVRFERAMGQLERFVDDRVLIARKDRIATARALERARVRRDAALGADARSRAQTEMDARTARIAQLDERIDDLEARRDEDYQRWRRHHHERRYRAPTLHRLFTVPFQLGTVTSC